MKKKYLKLALAFTIASSLCLTSCIGSFELTHKVMRWNRAISDKKWVNEIVFAAFWVVPVYEITALADILIINSIEFWKGTNPVSEDTVMIDGRDARYRVQRDANGYTVTNLATGVDTRLNYDAATSTWSVSTANGDVPFLTWVDDTHVSVPTADGSWKLVSRDDANTALYALAR